MVLQWDAQQEQNQVERQAESWGKNKVALMVAYSVQIWETQWADQSVSKMVSIEVEEKACRLGKKLDWVEVGLSVNYVVDLTAYQLDEKRVAYSVDKMDFWMVHETENFQAAQLVF